MPKKIEVDVAGICSIVHNCDGCAGKSRHCCSSYDITIDEQELIQITGCLPLAAPLCPHLVCKGEFRNIFEQVEPDLFSIDSDESNLCSFAYHQSNKLMCALHTISIINGIPLCKIKPRACLLWPLAICDTRTKILTIQDDAFEFDCNKPNDTEKWTLCPSLAESIEILFGKAFRHEIDNAAQKGLAWVKIPLRR
jgi:predicted metal-binding protein